MNDIEKSISSEISRLNDKIDKITEKINAELRGAKESLLKHIEEAEKDRDRKMKKIKYIGVEFEPTDVKKGEEEVNTALKAGFEPIRDFQTPKGVVMGLGLWGDRKRTD